MVFPITQALRRDSEYRRGIFRLRDSVAFGCRASLRASKRSGIRLATAPPCPQPCRPAAGSCTDPIALRVNGEASEVVRVNVFDIVTGELLRTVDPDEEG